MLLIKALKFRLRVFKSEKYINWIKKKHHDKDAHHVVGRKTTDYLIVPLDRSDHNLRHKKPNEYIIEDLIRALNLLSTYVKELENGQNKKPRN